jgi:hypothetical protein
MSAAGSGVVRPRLDSHVAFGLAIAASLVFCALIWAANGWLARFENPPDRPGMFYQWQLPSPDLWAQVTSWLGYLLHQLTLWALIWKAQRAARTGGLTWSRELKPVNVAALGANAFFVLLHFAQTHLFYDGLAQDVPEWTAQFSVILLLLVVILMENPRRGIAFGKPWGGFVRHAGDVARRYHGYYFAWATVWTFWYHPMIFTSGHILGFLYMFLLFAQGSLFFTRAHVNRYWTLSLEALVMVHGVIVALMNADGMWHMFGFGLAGVFVVTQAWGLGLRRSTCWAPAGAYVLAVIAFYSGWGWEDFPAVFRILGGYYVALPVVALVVLGLARSIGKLSFRINRVN